MSFQTPRLNAIRHADLLALIDTTEVVSFDIFDTLFVRPLVDPEDAFDLLGERFNVIDFRRIRRAAQTEAFRRMAEAGRREITLDDIYACMSGLPENVNPVAMRDAEFKLELALTVPNPDLIEIFRNLIGRKQVVIVSDMYLPREFFEALFERHALPHVPMYISADRGETKRDHGALFDQVLADVKVSPDQIIHIGDNLISDVQRAQERGLRAFHYINAANALYTVSTSLGASMAASMAKLYGEEHELDSLYGLGFRFGGPAAVGLLEWVRDQALADKVDVVLFVARDGYILEQLAQREYVSGLPKHAYFPGSRVSFALSTVHDHNFEAWLDFLVAGAHGLSPDEVIERIGVSLPAREVMEEIGLGDHVIIGDRNIGRLRDFLSAYRSEIIKTAVRNRRGLFNLLCDLGMHPGMRVAMVDVGWGGTTQETFRNALAEMLDVELVGYYLALVNSPECQQRRKEMNMRALLEVDAIGAERMNKLYERRVGIELMFSAPHEAVIGYELTQSGGVRVIEDPGRGSDPLALRKAVQEIQRGMLDFSEAYKAVSEHIQYKAKPVELAQAVVDFAHMSTEYCIVLDRLKNFDAWGSSRNLNLAMLSYAPAGA